MFIKMHGPQCLACISNIDKSKTLTCGRLNAIVLTLDCKVRTVPALSCFSIDQNRDVLYPSYHSDYYQIIDVRGIELSYRHGIRQEMWFQKYKSRYSEYDDHVEENPQACILPDNIFTVEKCKPEPLSQYTVWLITGNDNFANDLVYYISKNLHTIQLETETTIYGCIFHKDYECTVVMFDKKLKGICLDIPPKMQVYLKKYKIKPCDFDPTDDTNILVRYIVKWWEYEQ